MSKTKILFINSDVTPYTPETRMSTIGRILPQAIQEAGHEIRNFMPRFGTINERRNQLHEVIRLSGMNLIVNDADHPLIIKVASIQAVRMQYYFIDNDDYFNKRGPLSDPEKKTAYPDTVERLIFYARGVIETISKLRWTPDVVYCQGWFAALIPLLIRKCFGDTISFRGAKVVFAAFDNGFSGHLPNDFSSIVYSTMRKEGVIKSDLSEIRDKVVSFTDLCKLAIKFSDGLILADDTLPVELKEYAQKLELPILEATDEELDVAKYEDFFQLYAKPEE